VTQPGPDEHESGPAAPHADAQTDAPSESWRAEYESFDEVGGLPWESVLRDWMTRRLPSGENSKWVTLGAVLLGNFAAGIVFTLLSVARQTIATDIGSTPSLLTWAFTGPSLVAAVVAPALGRFGDLRGHKRMLAWSRRYLWRCRQT
jgi:hypothetical protein